MERGALSTCGPDLVWCNLGKKYMRDLKIESVTSCAIINSVHIQHVDWKTRTKGDSSRDNCWKSVFLYQDNLEQFFTLNESIIEAIPFTKEIYKCIDNQ